LTVDSIAFSPDGRFLATASHDKTVRLWNLDGPTEVRRFPGDPLPSSIALSPDGRFLGSGWDEGAFVWETASGECIVEAEDGEGVAFSPDGKEVATSGRFGLVERWSLPKGQQRHAWSGPYAKEQTDRYPTCALAYSPDGKNIAVAYALGQSSADSH